LSNFFDYVISSKSKPSVFQQQHNVSNVRHYRYQHKFMQALGTANKDTSYSRPIQWIHRKTDQC